MNGLMSRRSRSRFPLVLGWGALCWLQAYHGCGPQPALPEFTIPESLDAEIRSLVDDHVERVREDPSNAEQLGQLGLVFEANALWQQARPFFDAAALLAPREPVWAYHAARATQKLGDFDGAVAAMHAVVESFPSFAPAQHHLGDLLLGSGDIDGADAAFRRAVSLRRKSPEGHVGLGRVALERRDYAAAITALEHALSLQPGHKMAAFLVGRAYRRLGRTEDADRAQARGEDAEESYIPDRTSRDLARYSLGYSTRLDHAVGLIRAGKSADALVVLEKMYQERPRDLMVMNNLAVAYRRMNRAREALVILDAGIAAHPDAFGTYINKADCLASLKQYPQALAAANVAIGKAPQIAQAHFERGKALLFMGEFASARESLETAIGLDNRRPGFHQFLAQTCLRLKDLAGARAALEELLLLTPQNRTVPVHASLGIVCVDLEDWTCATRALEAARKLEPNHGAVKQLEQYYEHGKKP
jgi:tetratricopeptide (TPR) repeat protein